MTNDPESPPWFSSPPASPCQLRTTTSTKQTPAFGQLLAKYRFSDKTKFDTHTFFAQPLSKLSIPSESLEEFYTSYATYLETTPANQRNGATGLNSITEKTQSRFKFFVDLDLKMNAFEEGTIHLDNVPQLMTDILCTFTQVLKLMFPDSQTIDCITAFRMVYKCHAYFPSVVCEVAQAKAVCLTVTKCLTRKYPWIATMKVIDDSVYTSGLRILGSHKGAMNRTQSECVKHHGVYDLTCGEFRPSTPTDYISMTCGYAFPDAIGPKIRNDILTFFSGIQRSIAEREYLQRFLGSSLHGEKQDELFHIFTGGTRNGKSVLADVMKYTLGDYYTSIKSTLLTGEQGSSSSASPDLMALPHKRFV
ncbi:UNVERIFIED_CONTAM: hypothetical protein HDU68_011310 [Siphonaria sp. JEL0065]|nr:hypothetical protein HDU68_011310 [Siphonaria sp. JEL0065]